MENIKTAKDFIDNPEHQPNYQITSTDGKTYWISRSVAVLAAVVAFNEKGWNILVNKRGDGTPDFQGMWNIPCGYVDWGETCEQAAAREIHEECGISISPDKFKLFMVESDPKRSNKQNITIRFICIVSPEMMEQHLSDINSEFHEVDDIRWINFDEADQFQWAFNHRELLDIIKNHLNS